jgi:hypothetical protein
VHVDGWVVLTKQPHGYLVLPQGDNPYRLTALDGVLGNTAYNVLPEETVLL